MFADITLSTEAAVAITALFTAGAAAYTKVGMLLLAAKDDRYADMMSQRNSYREMNAELLDAVEDKIRRDPALKPLIPALAAVVPEHSSPATVAQTDDAKLATDRARVTAAKLALGLPPRESQ